MHQVMHEVMQRVEESAEVFRQSAAESEKLGRLSDVSAKQLRETGVIRLLQPREYGGYEAHPVEFFETVLKVGSLCGSAGWVSGVVGIHPWQLGQWDKRLQQELWGEDPDTWIASPYAPIGRARKVEGGYRFSGRWPFSSGTDHCDWIILGGLMVDDEGKVLDPEPHNFVLPRSDYTIHHDSWDVLGLRGSGSKDVSVADAFIPDYRVNKPANFVDGYQAELVGRDAALYRLPFGTIFPAAINCATLAMAEGALGAFIAFTQDRVTGRGPKAAADPVQTIALGEAAADVAASHVQFMDDWNRLYDLVEAGHTLTREQRIVVRRNGVRAVRRAVDAVDRLFMNAGGAALQQREPLQRFWRDLHAGMNHMCNVAHPLYQAYGADLFGLEVDPFGW
jgi:3-hydroxy-9,10-secoandrosta-1,3,5(10)-triene-9,17-dione monooxygenase